MERVLAAILYADAVGYSRLTGKDEEGTHEELDTALDLLTEIIEAHEGEKLHEAGDAVLAEFRSVTQAVAAALAFQRRTAERIPAGSSGDALRFRIGVNLGEVIRDRGDIYGEGVNIAARIQELAEPGGMCISGAVYEQLRRRSEEPYDDLGYRKLKNIAEPVHVYRARLSSDDEGHRPAWPFLDGGERQPVAEGGCLCKRVRYEVWEEPIAVGYCHCRFCQLAIGAPLSAWVIYRSGGVKFSGDAPKRYQSSPIAERAFCGNCGTSLFTHHVAPDESGYIPLRLATMDHPEHFTPTMHYGVESQIPWLEIRDDLPRVRTDDDPEMQRRWRAVGRPDPADQRP